MVRVLIVDDSATARGALQRALAADPEITVVGEAENGAQAVRAVCELRPDLVTIDVYLRRENGLEVTSRIMRECARPILVVTGADTGDRELVYRAMKAGALEIHAKLPASHRPDYATKRDRLQRLVKTLAKIPVVHRHNRGQRPLAEAGLAGTSAPQKPQCVLIGASTGGPPVLEQILATLERPFPLPILVAQHLSAGFADGLAQWLEDSTGHAVSVVTRRAVITAGTVYFPGDERHLELVSAAEIAAPPVSSACIVSPSVTRLFSSAAVFLGARAAAVLLTGMARDGAEGMQTLQARGATTFAQRLDTCVVDSMPRHAIEAGAVRHVLSPREIARHLNALARGSHGEVTVSQPEPRP